ncbi:UvrD-helicase domain-containing protein [Halalkalibaculum sp. DA3122]|uniref:nuclease-related domain-containing DEAD/DEAH box helicase n=1 Tax=Halalkalibaculum sp. DA3122 TaxID=3373607 RepID=UPI003754DA91
MALYPNNPPTQNYFNSDAERKVFQRARKSKVINSSNQNYLFHSLRVQDANLKLTGEVDFVYLDKEFILFLEVKGGEVKYDSATNQWWTLGGTKKQDPFKQVCTYLFNIRDNHFPKKFSGDYYDQKLKFGYGVMFPESGKPFGFREYSKKYRDYSIEYTPEIMYLKSDHDRRFSFDIYLENLKEYWRSYPKYNSGFNGIDYKGLEKIKNFFRTDLIFRVPISEHLTEDKEETQFYTEKQAKILRDVNHNTQFGFFINGGPGTGKTVLALEQAYQKSVEGKKVLLVCFNRCLSIDLEGKFKKAFTEVDDDKIHITTLHSLFLSLLRSNEYSIDVKDDKDFWEKELPKHFYKVFENYSFEDLYDYVVIDEGQDIFRESYMNCLGLLLKGGWDSHNWIVFLDKEFQTIYSDFDTEYFDLFKTTYQGVHLDLEENCRNTPGIIKKAHIHTGLQEIDCMKSDRLKPELRFYSTTQELFKIIDEIVGKLIKDNVNPGSITVLTNNNKIDQFINRKPELYVKLNRNGCHFPKDKVSFSTPHSFKGLENDFIIYTGRDYLKPDDRSLQVEFYVSYTRARTQLYLVFNESIKDSLKEISDRTIDLDISKRI